jgi:hypothetical protein
MSITLVKIVTNEISDYFYVFPPLKLSSRVTIYKTFYRGMEDEYTKLS